MEIIFLGTGGGRINLIKQIRATGGFRINSSTANIHVDPGPGALLNSIKAKQDVLKLDVVIVTHNHIDHVCDAEVLAEAISDHTLKKQGIIIGSKNVIEGDANDDRGISRYHQSRVAEVYVAKLGERKKISTKKGSFEIEFTRTKHDEPSCFGFRLFLDGKVIGYTSDTEYFEGISEQYNDCDALILNCLKPEKDYYKGHMETADVIKIVSVAKPKLAVMTHFGMKMIAKKGITESEAKKVEGKIGIKCIAANDFQKIEL